jgi:hypothetical protein
MSSLDAHVKRPRKLRDGDMPPALQVRQPGVPTPPPSPPPLSDIFRDQRIAIYEMRLATSPG